MSEQREQLIELLAQTLAPRLYKLFGTPPDEMGFPIYDTKEEVEEHLARQFDPISYWIEQGRQIAASILRIMEAGGAQFGSLDLDKMLKASASERPDMTADGGHLSIDKL